MVLRTIDLPWAHGERPGIWSFCEVTGFAQNNIAKGTEQARTGQANEPGALESTGSYLPGMTRAGMQIVDCSLINFWLQRMF